MGGQDHSTTDHRPPLPAAEETAFSNSIRLT
jgi:hypothetical protein